MLSFINAIAEKKFFLPQRHKKCNQHGHVICKCKDKTVIYFSCKKQGCSGKYHPNPKREPNSRDQSLQTNQGKKFLREDVQVYVTLVSTKAEKEVVVDWSYVFHRFCTLYKTLATTSYRMPPLELVELKRQLEKLLEK
ncbi:hypothetical protein CR513_30837, partial [Mucuna pruriens]